MSYNLNSALNQSLSRDGVYSGPISATDSGRIGASDSGAISATL